MFKSQIRCKKFARPGSGFAIRAVPEPAGFFLINPVLKKSGNSKKHPDLGPGLRRNPVGSGPAPGTSNNILTLNRPVNKVRSTGHAQLATLNRPTLNWPTLNCPHAQSATLNWPRSNGHAQLGRSAKKQL